MASNWGQYLKISIFGESHGAGIGVTMNGIPPGIAIDQEALYQFMARRAPGKDKLSTARKESDIPETLSGIYQGKTTGAPIAAIICNKDTQSHDYDEMASLARPGHADYSAFVRYDGYHDPRGGGHFSGRLTAPLCYAGAVAKQILESCGIVVGAHIMEIGGVQDTPLEATNLSKEILCAFAKGFPVQDASAGVKMSEAIEKARLECDSVGGVVECGVVGFPSGFGSPMFDGIENRLASILFGIPAVKGVSFGAGFGAARLRGSVNNDPFYLEQDQVRTKTNHAGGILGGISTGMPIIVSAAFKPTPSIAKEQDTIDFRKNTEARMSIHGRHDPCVVVRAVPVVESAVAIGLLDCLLEGGWNLCGISKM